jgi:hypothetical protein
MVIWGHSLIVTLDEIRFFEVEIEKRAAEATLTRERLELEKLGAANQVLEPPEKETLGESAVVELEQDSPTSDEMPISADSMNSRIGPAQESKSWTSFANAVKSQPTIGNPPIERRTLTRSPYYRRVLEPPTPQFGRYTPRIDGRFRRASD